MGSAVNVRVSTMAKMISKALGGPGITDIRLSYGKKGQVSARVTIDFSAEQLDALAPIQLKEGPAG